MKKAISTNFPITVYRYYKSSTNDYLLTTNFIAPSGYVSLGFLGYATRNSMNVNHPARYVLRASSASKASFYNTSFYDSINYPFINYIEYSCDFEVIMDYKYVETPPPNGGPILE